MQHRAYAKQLRSAGVPRQAGWPGIDDRFNDIAETLGIHPVTAGRCAEKGKKLVDNDDGIWEILEKCS